MPGVFRCIWIYLHRRDIQQEQQQPHIQPTLCIPFDDIDGWIKGQFVRGYVFRISVRFSLFIFCYFGFRFLVFQWVVCHFFWSPLLLSFSLSRSQTHVKLQINSNTACTRIVFTAFSLIYYHFFYDCCFVIRVVHLGPPATQVFTKYIFYCKYYLICT